MNAASLVFSSSTNISSTTSSASDTLINLHARYDKTFDEILSSRESNQVVTRIEDLSDRIKTWTDTTTTILNQEYRGLNR
ncbi:hypothetical protein H6769_02625 [Candidatus Peribacteria bacterium]|nr:hypothetical protein [Candidatus Peribacteria bacterium]